MTAIRLIKKGCQRLPFLCILLGFLLGPLLFWGLGRLLFTFFIALLFSTHVFAPDEIGRQPYLSTGQSSYTVRLPL